MAMTRAILGAAVAAMSLMGPIRAAAQDPSNVPIVRPQDSGERFRSLPERVQLDTLVVWTEIVGNPGESFSRAKRVLDSLKVPYTEADSAIGMIANPGFSPRGGRLAGRPNSSAMLCGFGPSGQYADVWRVTISYVMYVKQSDELGGTKIGIGMLAQAKDIHGTSHSTLLCTTTGNFEREVTTLVRKGLLR
jgi:hypothetical protein